MGQLLTTPTVKSGISPFLNLPREALRSLLQSYSLYGEGWGVDYGQVEEIFNNAPYMVNTIGYTEEDLKMLFQVFDTDNNGLIDALEMFITLALVSGMDIVDKLQFAFSTYDFDYSGMLSREEVSLLLRSAVKGLCKVADAVEPTSDVMDATAEIIFNDLDRSKDGKISVYEFQNNAVQQPVLGSWLHCFGNIEPPAEPPDLDPLDIDVQLMSFASVVKKDATSRPLTLSKADTMTNAAIVEAQKAKRLEELSKPAEPVKTGLFGGSRPTSAKASTRIDVPLSPMVRPAPLESEPQAGLANCPMRVEPLPWFRDVDLLRPDEVPRSRRDPPEDVVEPVWLHGCRAADVRSHLKYGPNGSVLFFTSAIAVQMAKSTGDEGEDGAGSGLWQQKFVFDHDAPITCLDYCPATRMAATADCTDGAVGVNKDGTQQQRKARIVLWSAETTTCIAVIEIAECAGIRYLDFSADGSRLLALSMDRRNTLYMYDVASRKLIFSNLLGAEVKVMAMSFARSPALFSVASSRGVDFYTEDVGGYMGAGRMVNFKRNQGLFHTIGKQSKSYLTNCLTDMEMEDELASGNAHGSVILWRGRNCVQVLTGVHEGSVLTLHYSGACKILVSGGNDGKVKLMRVAASNTARGKRKPAGDDVRLLEIFASLDISNSDVLSRQIRSVCVYSDGSRALIGTKSGEIVELSCIGDARDRPLVAAGGEGDEPTPEEGEARVALGDDVNGGPILKAHWDNSAGKFGTVSVWGLCRVPTGGFLSCGSDYTVRRWATADGAPQKEVKNVVLDSGVVSIACSAACVAIGFNGLGNATRANSVQLLNLETMASQQILTEAASTVQVLQFSVDGNMLACGCADGTVLIYAMAEGAGFSLKGKLERHSSAVRHIDFAADGAFIRTSENGAVKYWDVAVNFGAIIKEAEILKSVVWATSTTPYTWDSKGAFYELVGTEEVTCVDRSNHLVVSGLSTGAILLTRLPNEEMSLESSGYRGVKQEAHCGRIAALCYIDEGSKLVTAGAEDGLIQVWKVGYDFDEGEPEPEAGAEDGEPPPPNDEDDEDDEDGENGKAVVYYDSGEDEDMLDGEDMEWPEQKHADNVALKPGGSFDELNAWMQSVGLSEQSTWNLQQGSAPDAEMSLEWVYGYSSRLTRGSVKYTTSGSIAYPAATVAVVFDKKNRSQLHAMNHQSEISCMDVHPTSGYAVTAQRGKDHIFACVWNTSTGVCRGRMDCGRVHGASAVAFSPDGTLIAVACQDFSHSILIFDWEHNVLRTRVSGGAQKVLNLAFSLSPATYVSGLRIMQGGVGHFQLLELKGRQLTAKRGLYGAGMPKRNVLCSAALPIFSSMEAPNEFVVGMSDGSIGVLSKGERKFAQVIPVTSKAVTSICVMKGTDADSPFRVITGSIDGHIRIIDHEFSVTAQYNVYLTGQNLYRMGMVRGIKSIACDKANRKILYGTAGGEIGEINVADGLDVNKGALVSSHCRDFVTGLSTHPLRQECATVGGDKTLRIWNLERRSMNTMIELTDVANSVCYSPNAQLIAVGLGGTVRGTGRMPREHEGELVVVSYLQGTLRIVFGSKDAAGALNAFVFSPDGAELYAGSEDGKIYVYDVLDDFKLLHSLEHHTAGVRGLDISEDGRYLCSVGADNALAVWDVNAYKLLEDPKKNAYLPTAEWLQRTIPMGFDTLGVHQPHIAMNFITSLHRSSDKTLVATSDCAGGVSLFSYPCPKPGAPYKEFFGHTPGGVALARFTFKDDYLMTAGIDDKCLFQWRINKSPRTVALVENPSEPRDTTAQDSAVSAIRPNSRAGGGVNNVRPLMLASHTWQYHSFAHEEATAVTIDEECAVPTVVGNVDFTIERDCSPPEVTPKLNAVLGMGGVSYIAGAKSAMPVAFYCGSGQIVTSMGSLVYTYDSDRYGQSVWDIPEGQEIGAIAVSHDSRYVLVAEKPPAGMDKPESPSFFAKQRIFNASTGSLVKVLPGSIIGGVSTAQFSPDGLQAACLSCDYQHSITMFNTPQGTWKDAVRTFVSQIDSMPVTLLSFIVQSEDQTEPSPFQFATGGEGVLRFWKLRGRNATSNLHSSQGTKTPKITAMTSLKSDQLITGDAEGHITVWEGRDFVKITESAHVDMISALSRYQSKKYGHGLMSASNDGIVFWSEAFEQVMHFSVADMLGKINRPYTSNAYVSTVSVDAGCRRMLVTLQSSYVLELAMDSGAVLLVTEAHSLGKLSAVAAHPTDSRFVVSCGADGLLRLWNVLTRRPIAVQSLENAATSMTFRKSGETLAISATAADGHSGTIFILSFSTTGQSDKYVTIVDKIQSVGTDKITCVRYSPDEKMLLASSLDGKIYAFSVDKGYKLRAILNVHKGPCLSFDFSVSGKYLRSFGKLRGENTMEMYMHDLTKPVEAGIGSSVPSFAQIKDDKELKPLVSEAWTTMSPGCPEARGARQVERFSGIGVTDIATFGELCAAGYSDGTTKLFRNPPASIDADGIALGGHNSGGTKCAFTCDGKHLAVVGAADGSIILWEVKKA